MPTSNLDDVRPSFRPEREVRFAVVLYGGVSLAIYINGVVQEMLRLVRATAPIYPYPKDPWTQRVYFPTTAADGLPEPLRGTELVYRKLAQALPLQDKPPESLDEIPAGTAVRTRFVIDILSGSSAGGINGIFLAKALANQQDIDTLRKLWVDEGDIGMLLNDKRSYASLPADVERQDPPRSLLNGQRLYTKAYNALRDMAKTTVEAADDETPCYVEELDLFVTTTDLQGLLMPIVLYDELVYEHRHRHVFHFGAAIEEATGGARNDFGEPNDGILAFAARATSSFPFAFEPVLLEDVRQVDASLGSRFDDWGRFFAEYVQRKAEYTRYAFADGGYLDNKPFTHATSALRRRRSDVPVERKLVYIEPDPSGIPTPLNDEPLPAEPPKPRPDVIDNVQAAAMGLPRSEPIRDDIQAVLDRNATIDEIRRLTLRVEEDFIRDGDGDPFAPLRGQTSPDAPDAALDVLLGDCAVFHRSYRSLRAATVAEELTSTLAAVAHVDEESDTYRAMALVVRTWIEVEHADNLNAFLYRFDLGYRLRRLKFLQDRLNDLLRGGERRDRMLRMYSAVAEGDSEARERSVATQLPEPRELLALKLALNEVFVELRRRGRIVRQGEPTPAEPPVAGGRHRGRTPKPGETAAVTEIRQELGGLAKEAGELHEILKVAIAERQARFDEQRTRALEFVKLNSTRLATLEESLGAYLVETFEAAGRDTINVLLAGPDASPGYVNVRRLIHDYYERFDRFDAISLPLTHPELGETNPVDIIRVSPQDATDIIDEVEWRGERRKLGGAAVHHFGGFFDANWRRNDILWGRLDGAERILAAVLPDGPLRRSLLLEAQGAIVREELLDHYVPGLTDILAGALLRDEAIGDGIAASAVERLASGTPLDQAALVSALRKLPDKVLIDHLRDTYRVPAAGGAEATLGVAGRAVQVTGKVLEETSRQRNLPTQPWFWATRVGRLAWGVAEVAMPRPRRTIPGLMFRYWTELAVLLGVLLILFGVLGVEEAQKVGWILLGIVVGTRALVWVAEALTAPPPSPPLSGVPLEKPTGSRTAPQKRPRTRSARALWWLERVALLVVAIGFLLVVVGIFASGVLEAGWWVIAAGLAAALLLYLARVGMASHRRLLAIVLAAVVVGVIALAAIEVGRHGGDDVRAAASILPGDRDDGFEGSVRDAADAVWQRVWPWN